MDLNAAALEEALGLLGQLLADRGRHYEVVAVGGGGLLLLGQIVRTTKDLDLVALVESGQLVSANPLPLDLLEVVHEVGQIFGFAENWLNAGPASLFEMGLPEGFKARMKTRHFGGLTLHFAGRFDQICFKLYASIDHGPESKHFTDLQALNPTDLELQEAGRWCVTQDVSPVFAATLDEVLAFIGAKNGAS